VADGRVRNATEYEEMLDFTGTLVSLADQLPKAAAAGELRKKAEQLRLLVESKAEAGAVSWLAGDMRQQLIRIYGLSVVPRQVPDLARGQAIYAQRCVACHGIEGRGDGPLANSLDPHPTDFTDLKRYRERTLYGLFNTISQGVPGTAMNSFAALPESDRWALAFYVGQLAPAAHQAQLVSVSGSLATRIGPYELTTLTPAEAEARFGTAGARQMAWLRMHPDELFGNDSAQGVDLTLQKLEASLSAYRKGDAKGAHELAVSAYLDGFEMLEGSLDAVNSDLRHRIEAAMTQYRALIKKGADPDVLAQRFQQLETLLASARQALASQGLSPATAFTSALVILLREGLEAILVLAALAAFLLKTGRRDGLRYLYLGTGGALVLGLLTWFVSSRVITLGGAGRELTEGLAALFAAAMLFYLGFWLHSKTSAAQWKRFIQGSVNKALSKGTLWGLAGLAFIAVYREIFETVLFYQALWMQAGRAGQGTILIGFLAAAALLLVLAWLILRYSTSLPLRQFFSVTTIFMFVLAVVFAGKGIAALQEAGKLPMNLVDLPSIELLGIYPNLEGLGVQLAMVLLAVLLLWRGGRHGASGDDRASRA
jgi:high-affinity iron transporter